MEIKINLDDIGLDDISLKDVLRNSVEYELKAFVKKQVKEDISENEKAFKLKLKAYIAKEVEEFVKKHHKAPL